MIYVDISAAVHARAGLGRYSETLAQELIAAQPERFALFYNRGKDGRFPPTLPTHIPQKSVQWGYKPWRMAVLLGQWGHVGFNRLVPGAETVPQHRTFAYAPARHSRLCSPFTT